MPAALAGKYVAWSPDGLRILGHGMTLEEARSNAGDREGLVIQKIPPAGRIRAVKASLPPDDSPAPSVWTEAKVQAVLGAVRSTLANLANKHGVPLTEIVSLVRDQLSDPG